MGYGQSCSSRHSENHSQHGAVACRQPPVEYVLLGESRLKALLWSREVMGHMAICIRLPLSPFVSVSLIIQKVQPLLKNKESYIFITKCCGFFLHHGYTTNMQHSLIQELTLYVNWAIMSWKQPKTFVL